MDRVFCKTVSWDALWHKVHKTHIMREQIWTHGRPSANLSNVLMSSCPHVAPPRGKILACDFHFLAKRFTFPCWKGPFGRWVSLSRKTILAPPTVMQPLTIPSWSMLKSSALGMPVRAATPRHGTRTRWHLLNSFTSARLPSGHSSSKSSDVRFWAHAMGFLPKAKPMKPLVTDGHCGRGGKGRSVQRGQAFGGAGLPSVLSMTVVCLTKATSPASSARHLWGRQTKGRNAICQAGLDIVLYTQLGISSHIIIRVKCTFTGNIMQIHNQCEQPGNKASLQKLIESER